MENYFFDPELLKDARKAAGLTQPGLADKAGLSFGSIYGYEHGERVPGAVSLGKLAAALRVEVGALFSRTRQRVST